MKKQVSMPFAARAYLMRIFKTPQVEAAFFHMEALF